MEKLETARPISSFYQRLILREMKKPGTTACPGCWAMEKNKIVWGEEKNILYYN
jgi:hypothetical protein